MAPELFPNQFTVPATEKSGATRMRIIMHYGSSRTTTCGTFSDGEAEDYTVNITGGTLTGIASLDKAGSNVLNSLIVTPNPVKSSVASLVLQLVQKGQVNIKVTDLSGKVLLKQEVGNAQTGKNTIPLNGLNNLTNGAFIVVPEKQGVVVGGTIDYKQVINVLQRGHST